MDRDFLSLTTTQQPREERNGSVWNFTDNRCLKPFAIGKEDRTRMTQPELCATQKTFAGVQRQNATSYMRHNGSYLSLSQGSVTPETQHSAISPLLKAANQRVPALSSSNGSQLTIFVGGKVIVFDEVSAEKAQHIMSMAEELSRTTYIQSASSVEDSNHPEPSTPTAIMLSIPQARKASLARFLEKRKERVANASPYPLRKMI